MVIYFLLSSVGLMLFVLAIVGVTWMIRSGQLDDLDTPSLRMLGDDQPLKDTGVPAAGSKTPQRNGQ